MGIFSTSVMAELEEETDGELTEYFDLITGKSTGGIITILLGLGLSTEKILEFYRRCGPVFFSGELPDASLRCSYIPSNPSMRNNS